jgi:hypothetical protein
MIGTPPTPLDAPLTEREFKALAQLSRWLPLPWTASARRRRLMLLAAACPGFLTVFTTPIHKDFFVLLSGLAAFAAAMVLRRRTEGVFLRAEAAAVWPPASCGLYQPQELPHA